MMMMMMMMIINITLDAKDCEELNEAVGGTLTSGVYSVLLPTARDVFCDVREDGIWMVCTLSHLRDEIPFYDVFHE
jgi:hypothetical protein